MKKVLMIAVVFIFSLMFLNLVRASEHVTNDNPGVKDCTTVCNGNETMCSDGVTKKKSCTAVSGSSTSAICACDCKLHHCPATAITTEGSVDLNSILNSLPQNNSAVQEYCSDYLAGSGN